MVTKPDAPKIFDPKILEGRKYHLEILNSSEAIYDDIASRMINRLKGNNSSGKETVFILPVGPRGQYLRFVKRCNEENISCQNLITINMDEFLDQNDDYLPETSPFSFRGFMKNNLFDLLEDRLKMQTRNILFPDPKEPEKIYELLKLHNGADICFAGVGINGHIAFNEPVSKKLITLAEFKKLRTRVLDLDKETIIMTSLKHGGYLDKIPGRCITIGISEILLSKEIRVYLEHPHQAAIFEKILFQDPTPEIPVTVLKDHPEYYLTISTQVLESYRANK